MQKFRLNKIFYAKVFLFYTVLPYKQEKKQEMNLKNQKEREFFLRLRHLMRQKSTLENQIERN